MNKYFLKYKFSYLLAMVSMASIAQNTNPHAHIIINQLGSFAQEILSVLEAFLSKNDNKTYSEHMKIFKNTIDKHPLMVRSELHSDLEKRANSLVQEFKRPFVKTQAVLKKYQGKNKGSAGNLVKDLKTALPLKEIFSNLKVKLTILLKKAKDQGDVKLANIINPFIKYIEKKETTWNGMSQIQLFTTLCRRMNLG